MKQQFLIESNSIFHHSNYSKYLKHKIYDFFLFNIIIFISLFSSFFSDERKIRKIKIVIVQNNENGGDMHIIKNHQYNGENKRNCPSTICEKIILVSLIYLMGLILLLSNGMIQTILPIAQICLMVKQI